MSIGEKIQTIGEKLPNVYGAAFTRGRDRGYTAGHKQGYSEGYTEGGENGYQAGRKFEKNECLSVHYTASVLGSGKRSLSFEIPFKPDVISVYSLHPYSGQVANSFKGFLMDLRACGQHMGSILFCMKHDNMSASNLTPALGNQVIEYSGGTFTFELPENIYSALIWPSNVRYAVMATRYLGETGVKLLQEQISLLPDEVPEGHTGTLNYSKDMVLQYLSLQEWESLIATKPNWTFVLG